MDQMYLVYLKIEISNIWDSAFLIFIKFTPSFIITITSIIKQLGSSQNHSSKMHLLKTMITFLSLLFISTAQWLPKIVWTFWNKPLEQENDLLKALHKSHADRLTESGWQLWHLNDDNLWSWVGKIPKLKQAYDHPFWKQLTAAMKVDFIRVAILSYYGGVYMDMSVILTQNFDWLLNLRKLPYIQNVYGDQPNIFYTYARHSYKERYFDVQTKQKFIIQPAIQLSFMACKPNNTFMIEWLNFAIDQKIKNFHKYTNTDRASIFLDIAKQQKIDIGKFNDKYFDMSVAAIILLARKQRQMDKIWNYDPIKPRQLIVKDLKLWTVDSYRNSYLYWDFSQGYSKSIISIPVSRYIKQGQGALTPFVKMWHWPYWQILKFLKSKQQLNCRKDLFLFLQSVLYQYVLKTYPTKFYAAPIYDHQTYIKECTIQGQAQKYQIQLQKIRKQTKQQAKHIEEINQKISSLVEESNMGKKQIVSIREKRIQFEAKVSLLIKKNKELQILAEQEEFYKKTKSQLPLVSRLKLKTNQILDRKKQNLQKISKIQVSVQQLLSQKIQKNNLFQKLGNKVSQSFQILNEAKYYKQKVNKFGPILILLLTFFAAVVIFLLFKLNMLKKSKNNMVVYMESLGKKTALPIRNKEVFGIV